MQKACAGQGRCQGGVQHTGSWPIQAAGGAGRSSKGSCWRRRLGKGARTIQVCLGKKIEADILGLSYCLSSRLYATCICPCSLAECERMRARLAWGDAGHVRWCCELQCGVASMNAGCAGKWSRSTIRPRARAEAGCGATFQGHHPEPMQLANVLPAQRMSCS